MDALSAALEAKNPYTCGHSERVAEIALLLARQLRLPKSEQTRIHIGAHLHDIGKIGIPDSILNKPGRLTPAEYAVIQRHPEIGDQIVKKIQFFYPVADIIRSHHEHFDGNGYPDRLRGEEISLGARIVSVADAVDAMTSSRPYRTPRSFRSAVGEIMLCRGTQFDPAVVDALVQSFGRGLLQVCGAEKTTQRIGSA